MARSQDSQGLFSQLACFAYLNLVPLRTLTTHTFDGYIYLYIRISLSIIIQFMFLNPDINELYDFVLMVALFLLPAYYVHVLYSIYKVDLHLMLTTCVFM